MKPRIPPPIVLAALVVCLSTAFLAHAQSDKTTPEACFRKRLLYEKFKQIELGYKFWKKAGALDHIDVLQLNLDEAKRFFSESFDQRRPLPSIVDVRWRS